MALQFTQDPLYFDRLRHKPLGSAPCFCSRFQTTFYYLSVRLAAQRTTTSTKLRERRRWDWGWAGSGTRGLARRCISHGKVHRLTTLEVGRRHFQVLIKVDLDHVGPRRPLRVQKVLVSSIDISKVYAGLRHVVGKACGNAIAESKVGRNGFIVSGSERTEVGVGPRHRDEDFFGRHGAAGNDRDAESFKVIRAGIFVEKIVVLNFFNQLLVCG